METVYKFLAERSRCAYLPDQISQLQYNIVSQLSAEEYQTLVQQGWRKFGYALFRTRCPACNACQPIRVVTDRFKPDRSQRRVIKANQDTRLEIGPPSVDLARVELHFKHHLHHAQQKNWPLPSPEHSIEHVNSFCDNPFPLQEWAYYRGDELVAVSYIDAFPEGYSGVYFYHSPEHRDLSLGTWICISLIQEAARRGLPYVYLGYYVENCRSMEYKGRFQPNQVLGLDGVWRDFLG